MGWEHLGALIAITRGGVNLALVGPPLPCPLLPRREEREKNILALVPRAALAVLVCPGLLSCCPFGARKRVENSSFSLGGFVVQSTPQMKLLVIGGGGREHALVWKLAQSPRVAELWCAPGNAGIADEQLARNGARVECVNISAEDLPKLLALAREKKPDLTVVGPDNPL